jgi:glycosyltransferase involved in cell wall biosynthesis
MSAGKAILLVGRRDEPTDGVVDYCERLSDAAARRGLCFELARVSWEQEGWRGSLAELSKQAEGWRGCWVLLQFTTLAWSRRGFPLRAPRVMRLLRQCGARPGVVFHDLFALPGKGTVGTVRELCQARALRQLYALSDLAVFTVPVNKIGWLPLRRDKAIFIPVGSNFPEVDISAQNAERLPNAARTVAVFGITGGDRGSQEVGDISCALKSVHSKGVPVRLAAIGRGVDVFERELGEALCEAGIEVQMRGLMPATDLVRILASTSVLLCARGHVSSRRGSVIAGIACGLPIVGYRGQETGFPITEAGVLLVNHNDRQALAQALVNVLTNEELSNDLSRRSRAAALEYFSWDAIASQFVTAMSA